MCSLVKLLVCMICLGWVTNYQTLAGSVDTLEGQMQYLQDYNYMAENQGPSPIVGGEITSPELEQAFSQAIALFQQIRGLNVTGQMNNETLEVMRRPRCGMPDILPDGDWYNPGQVQGGRKKRYSLLGRSPSEYGWGKNSLTYSLITTLEDNSKLPASKQKEIIQNAFNLWHEVANIEVKEHFSYILADIHMHFYKRYHGDISPFDGPGGKLAHAFSPSSGGDIHFDAEENWTLDDYSGKDLFQIAVHEIGHSLGLGHVYNLNSVMYPEYVYRNDYKLDQDDIDGMQFLYGPKQTTTTTTTTTKPETTSTATEPPANAPEITTKKPTPTTTTTKKPTTTTIGTGSNDVCGSSLFDDVDFTTGNSEKIYIHKGHQIAIGKKYSSGFKVESVTTMGQEFPQLPSSGIDAVVTLPKLVEVVCTRWLIWYTCGNEFVVETARTYYFKGENYYMYQNGEYKEKGLIKNKFPISESDIEAAFTGDDGKDIYLVKGGNVWKISRETYEVRIGYPKQLSFMINGVPNEIKAATSTGPETFFFTSTFIYRTTYSTLSEMFTIDSQFTKKTFQFVDCSSIQGIADKDVTSEAPPMNETFSDHTTQVPNNQTSTSDISTQNPSNETTSETTDEASSNSTSTKTKRSASQIKATVYIDQNGQIVDTDAANFRWNREFEDWLEDMVDHQPTSAAEGLRSVYNIVTSIITIVVIWFLL